MICVTIGRTRHKMVVAEHRALAERGAEFVELRLDWITRSPDVQRLLKDRPTPVVITCRRPQDGGRFRGTEEQRMLLLRHAIVDGAEYVDLEEDIAGKVPRYGTTKRIVSHHDFERTPDDLEEIHARLCKLDPDVVKIVTMANSPRDNVRMLQLIAHADVPTVGFCMGDCGMLSRVLCGKYGAPFTYASFSKDRVMAPGQIAFDEMKKLYRFDDINPETDIFGVLGDPIGHSWSPLLHNLAYRKAGINAVYVPMRVPPEEFDETLKEFEFFGVQGYSVTIPHKEAALTFAAEADEAAEEIGAANTLFKNGQGNWCASNTDYDAALEALHLGLRAKGEESLNGLRVLLLGAGGAARAIGLGIIHEGGVLTISNRSKDRGSRLAKELNCQFVTWANRGAQYADVIINCTPVGMFPNLNETPYEHNWLRDGMVVFDTIYNPETTLLLKQARERDCHVVSGLEMFIRQASAQFKLFTGREAPLDELRKILRRGMSPVRVKTRQGHAAPAETHDPPPSPG